MPQKYLVDILYEWPLVRLDLECQLVEESNPIKYEMKINFVTFTVYVDSCHNYCRPNAIPTDRRWSSVKNFYLCGTFLTHKKITNHWLFTSCNVSPEIFLIILCLCNSIDVNQSELEVKYYFNQLNKINEASVVNCF